MDIGSARLLKAAARDDSDDNYLYRDHCPIANDTKDGNLRHSSGIGSKASL